jgi:hypothetical protein
VLTGGIVSSTGNAIHGNILTVGIVSSAGNITGGNISATNLTGTTLSVTGNITSNGQIVGTYTPGSTTGAGILSQGANTQGGSGYYDFLKATNQSGGATNANKSFRINSTGTFEIINSAYSSTIFSLADNGNTVIAGNLNVVGTLTYVNTTNLNVSNALITLANAATTPAQANGGGLQLNGANANIIYGSGNDSWNINKPLVVTGAVSASTTVSATGNITGGNVLTGGLVSAVGNITGAYIIGNGSQLTGVTAYTNANVAAYLPTYTGNIAAGNISATGNITGAYITGNASALTAITGANVTGVVAQATQANTSNIASYANTANAVAGANVSGQVANALVAGTVYTNAQPNITSLGVLSSLSVTANITGGNISATNHTGTTVSVSGTITAASVAGGVITGTSISGSGNVTGGNITTAGLISAAGNIGANNANITNYLYVGTAVSNLFKNVPLTVTGANAGNTITGINIVNTGGGGGSGSGIDFYTYTGAGYPPEASIYSVDNGDYSANINFATKVPGAGANTLAVRMTVASNGNVVIPGNVNVGNVIVNGQPTTYGVVNPDYINAGRITSDQTGAGQGSDIIFNGSIVSSGISLNTSTGVFTLTAGKTYQLFAELSFSNFSDTANGYEIYDWVDATTNTRLSTTGVGAGIGEAINRNTNEFNATSTTLIYTPTTNQTVKVRIVEAAGTVTVRANIGTKAIIQQINPTIAVQATATGTVAKNYAKYVRTASQSVSANSVIICNVLENTSGTAVSVNTSTGQVTLTAGTYRLRGTVGSIAGATAASFIGYAWYNETTSAYIGEGSGWFSPQSLNYNTTAGGTAEAVITVASTAVVSFRALNPTNVSSIGGTSADWGTPYAYPWIDIEQIGASFALNALDTMSTTGNVSVGGNLTITGGIRKSARVLTTTTALTIADASGFIEFNSGPYTVTLPDPTLAANSGIGYRFWQNTASNITLSTPAGGFYGPSGNSGASTKVLAQATTQYWDVWSDGYNWTVFGIKTV